MDKFLVRERLEEKEKSLSPFAIQSRYSRGRKIPEPLSDLRTEFQRDRDRILHTKAFRRLKHKTQVFLTPLGDHYVTRLTHTLEVTQIARTIARALNLNEDLTEAIGLGHDLGHTPFGHLGEEALNRLCSQGFKHNHHSLRIVEILEKDGKGLNLTFEVKQGIVSHSKPRGDFLANLNVNYEEQNLTLEAQIIRISDAVAYVNHDLADAFRARILETKDIPYEVTNVLGNRHSERINSLVSDIVSSSLISNSIDNDKRSKLPVISMTNRVRDSLYTLREFLFDQVYLPAGKGPEGKSARGMMELLFDYYKKHPSEIPEEYKNFGINPEQSIIDYIAGMTDQYAIRIAEKIQPGIAAPFLSRLI